MMIWKILAIVFMADWAINRVVFPIVAKHQLKKKLKEDEEFREIYCSTLHAAADITAATYEEMDEG